MWCSTLYIVINDAIVEAKQSQKIIQKFVPLGDLGPGSTVAVKISPRYFSYSADPRVQPLTMLSRLPGIFKAAAMSTHAAYPLELISSRCVPVILDRGGTAERGVGRLMRRHASK